ncbi:uncharacterized protein LOC144132180 [Amblyomma americanum]
MESTMTPLDEKQHSVDECHVSKGAMRGIQNTDPLWFGGLTLDPQSVKQSRSPQEVCGLTGQRKAARVEPDREEWRIRVPEPDGALVVQLWRHTLFEATGLRPRRLPTPFRPWRHFLGKKTSPAWNRLLADSGGADGATAHAQYL